MKTRIYKLVLGVFVTIISFSAYTQDYQYIPMVKPGVQIWVNDFAYYTPIGTIYFFHKFALTDEDTILDNVTYKKLYKFRDNEFNPSTSQFIGGIREDSTKRVYYKSVYHPYYTVGSTMLCDFSLSVGDTFSVNDFSVDTVVCQISSIDTINYEGVPRRTFTVKSNSYPNYYLATWIEGIGNYDGLLYDMTTRLVGLDFLGRLRCYIHNGTLLYHKYSNGINDCITPIMGIEDVLHDNSITLYPNPSNREINISSENIINSIEIFNSLGQRVYYSVVNSNTKTIDISSFVNGVYILGINTENGVIRKKIIKN